MIPITLPDGVRSSRATGGILRRFRRDSGGMTAIEVALVFPVMLLLYFGLVDVGTIVSADRRVTLATSTIADLVTQSNGTVAKADLQGFFNAAAPIMDPLPSSGLGMQLYGYRRNGSAVQLRWQYSQGGCGGAPTANTTQMQNLTEEGNDVVIARVCYQFQPILGKVIAPGPHMLSDEVVLRPRQSSTIVCSNC